MPSDGRRVIFPMHLLVKASFLDEAEQQNLKRFLDCDGLLALGCQLKASLAKHFKLACEFNLGLVPKLVRADSVALAPNGYAVRLAEQLSQETEQAVFLLSEGSGEIVQGPESLRPADAEVFPATKFFTLPFVLCFTLEDFKASGLAEDRAAYHAWRPNLTTLVSNDCGLVEAVGVAAYHRLFAALGVVHKNMLMDMVVERAKQRATLFLSVEGVDLLVSKGSVYLPFYTFEEYAEVRPDLEDGKLGPAYLEWLDKFRLLTYGLEKRKLRARTVSVLGGFKTLDLATMEKIARAASPLSEVIETPVLDNGWEKVQDMILDIYQDETKFVCSILSGFSEGGDLVYQTNFHVSDPAGIQVMQDRVRELVNSCGIETTVKQSTLHYQNRKLISRDAPRQGISVSSPTKRPAPLVTLPSSKTLH